MGYEVKNRKVLVIEEEADRVRTIYQRYLELGSLNLLMADLRAAQYPDQGPTSIEWSDSRWHPIRPWIRRPPLAKPVLHRRGRL